MLAEISTLTPWGRLHRLVEPFYKKMAYTSHAPVGLARLLRLFVAQQYLGLSEEGIEYAVYDSTTIRTFVGIDLNSEAMPDAASLLNFRDLLKKNNLDSQIFETIQQHLAAGGLPSRCATDRTLHNGDCRDY